MTKNVLGWFALTCAAMTVAPQAHASLSLLNFDIAQISVLQSSGNSFSGFVGWNPRLDLSSLYVKLDAGASLLTNGSEKFVAARGQALLGLTLSDRLAAEVGPGLQYWLEGTDNDGMPFFAGGNIRYKLNQTFNPFVGYAAIFVAGSLTHEIRIGTGIHF
jgi:hypothetical protein